MLQSQRFAPLVPVWWYLILEKCETVESEGGVTAPVVSRHTVTTVADHAAPSATG